MSNGRINLWDKVQRGKAMFTEAWESAEQDVKDIKGQSQEKEMETYIKELYAPKLFGIMQNDVTAWWSQMNHNTGYSFYREQKLSGIFMRNNFANFCTVSTTVLIIHKSGLSYFEELRYQHADAWLWRLTGSLGLWRVPFYTDTDSKNIFKIKSLFSQEK